MADIPSNQDVPKAVKSAYPPPAAIPTQEGPRGIRFDFNLGARIALPSGSDWCLVLRDLDTGNILFETRNEGATVTSSKRFYVRFSIEVWENGERVFQHDYNAGGREVLIQFPVGTLGDILAWLPYAERFAVRHGCSLICAMSPLLIGLLQDAYPAITFKDHEQLVAEDVAARVYATYCMGLFFDDAQHIWQPTDFRHVGLHRTA